jgi:hypothetical protein
MTKVKKKRALLILFNYIPAGDHAKAENSQCTGFSLIHTRRMELKAEVSTKYPFQRLRDCATPNWRTMVRLPKHNVFEDGVELAQACLISSDSCVNLWAHTLLGACKTS